MQNTTRALCAIWLSIPLALTISCRDEEPQPVPPLPPPEVPQQPQSGADRGDSVAPEGSRASSNAAPQATAQTQEKLFATYCVSCHGPTGTGDGPLAATLPTRPRNFRAGEFKFDTDADGKTGTLDDLTNVIKNGAARYGGSPLMAGFPTLPEGQIRELAGYVHDLSGAVSQKGG